MSKLFLALVCLFSGANLFAQSPPPSVPMNAPGYTLGTGSKFDMRNGALFLPFAPGSPTCLVDQVAVTTNGLEVCNNLGAWQQIPWVNGSIVINPTSLPPLSALTGSLNWSQIANPPAASSTTTGLLSSGNWATFNSKQNALAFGTLAETGSSILTITGATNALVGSGATINVAKSTAAQSGYLASGDWVTFNGKQNALAQANSATDGYLAHADFATFTGKAGQGTCSIGFATATTASGVTCSQPSISTLADGATILTSNQINTVTIQVAPSTAPAAGTGNVWFDSVNNNLETRNSTGLTTVMVQPAPAIPHQVITAIAPTGTVTQAQLAAADIVGLGSIATHPATDFIADPGANGFLKRTAQGISAVGLASDLPSGYTFGSLSTGTAQMTTLGAGLLKQNALAVPSIAGALDLTTTLGFIPANPALNLTEFNVAAMRTTLGIGTAGLQPTSSFLPISAPGTSVAPLVGGLVPSSYLPVSSVPTASSSVAGVAKVGSTLLMSASGVLNVDATQFDAANAALGVQNASLQKSTNLSDISSWATAIANLHLTGATPATLSISTTGNAATATALAATPSACPTGEYQINMTASGTPNCEQVAYAQVTGTPPLGTIATHAFTEVLADPGTAGIIKRGSTIGTTAIATSGDVISAIGYTPVNAALPDLSQATFERPFRILAADPPGGCSTGDTYLGVAPWSLNYSLTSIVVVNNVANVNLTQALTSLATGNPIAVTGSSTGNLNGTYLMASATTFATVGVPNGTYLDATITVPHANALRRCAPGQVWVDQIPSTFVAGSTPYTLPAASTTSLGGVIAGSGFVISNTGVISVTSTAPVWSAITGKPAFGPVATSNTYSDLTGLPTIPTTTSQIINNSGYLSTSGSNIFTGNNDHANATLTRPFRILAADPPGGCIVDDTYQGVAPWSIAGSNLASVTVLSNVATINYSGAQIIPLAAGNLITVSGSATAALNGSYAMATATTFAVSGVANSTYSDNGLVVSTPHSNAVRRCAPGNIWADLVPSNINTGSAYTLPPATNTTLGGAIAGSGLTVSGGTFSVNSSLFDAAGSAASVQGLSLLKIDNLGGVASVPAALANLHLTGGSPLTISAPTTGNAGTATALAATPAACGAGQYQVSMAANGTPTCAQVAYGQVTGTPTLGTSSSYAATAFLGDSGTNGLVKRTGPGTSGTALSADVVTALGFTPASGTAPDFSAATFSRPFRILAADPVAACAVGDTYEGMIPLAVGSGLTSISVLGGVATINYNSSPLAAFSAGNTITIAGSSTTALNGTYSMVSPTTFAAGSVPNGTYNDSGLVLSVPHSNALRRCGTGSLWADQILPSSLQLGTTAGTAAAGNDNRIVNAVTAAQAAASAPVQTVAGVLPTAGNVAVASTNLTDTATLLRSTAGITGGAFNYDLSGAAHTIITKRGAAASIPSNCTIGELYFASDATPGQNLYECTSPNTWTQQLNTGSPLFSAVTSGINPNSLQIGGTLGPVNAGIVTANAFSGLLAPSNLPFPTATTIGGVRSYAPVLHQWLNTISLGGLPAASQPYSTDLADVSTLATSGQSFAGGAYQYDLTHVAHSLPVKTGPISGLPVSCTIGELYFASDATAGQNLYECPTINTWAQQPGGGGTVTNATLGATATDGLASRSIGVIYHNTAAAPLLVSATVGGAASGTTSALSDSVTPPTAVILAASGNAGYSRPLTFAVPPGYYYELTNDSGGTIAHWTETLLSVSGSGYQVATGALVNPSPTTLGGIQSLAPVARKWINTISTTGVPAATQPTSSDLLDSANLATSTQSFTGGAFTYDLSGAAHTLASKSGLIAALPSSCTIGEEYFATNATAGQNKYYCTAANTWTQQIAGSGGTSTFSGLTGGTNSAALLVSGSLAPSGSGTIAATSISGTSVPTNSVADQVLSTSAAATGIWTPVPPCLDSAGQHLNYNTTTHAFSCGTTGGGAVGPPGPPSTLVSSNIRYVSPTGSDANDGSSWVAAKATVAAAANSRPVNGTLGSGGFHFGTVKVAPGTYALSATTPIEWNAYSRVECAGAGSDILASGCILQLPAGATTAAAFSSTADFEAANGYAHYTTMEGLTIDGNGNSGTGIRQAGGGVDNTYRYINVINFTGGHGMWFERTTINVTLEHVSFFDDTNALGGALYWNDIAGLNLSTVTDMQVDRCGTDPIAIVVNNASATADNWYFNQVKFETGPTANSHARVFHIKPRVTAGGNPIHLHITDSWVVNTGGATGQVAMVYEENQPGIGAVVNVQNVKAPGWPYIWLSDKQGGRHSASNIAINEVYSDTSAGGAYAYQDSFRGDSLLFNGFQASQVGNVGVGPSSFSPNTFNTLTGVGGSNLLVNDTSGGGARIGVQSTTTGPGYYWINKANTATTQNWNLSLGTDLQLLVYPNQNFSGIPTILADWSPAGALTVPSLVLSGLPSAPCLSTNVTGGIIATTCAGGVTTYTSPYSTGGSTRALSGAYSKLSDTISVLDYIPASSMSALAGGTVTSGPDVTTYLQAAINAAEAAGKSLFLPGPYFYHTTNHLCITGGFGLKGESHTQVNPTSGALVNDTFTKSTLLNCNPTVDYQTDLTVQDVFFVNGFNDIDTGFWHAQHITGNTFDSPANSDWTCAHCERGEVNNNISIQRYHDTVAAYAMGRPTMSENASSFTTPYLAFTDRIDFIHNISLEGGAGTAHTIGSMYLGPPRGDGITYSTDSHVSGATISNTVVFGQAQPVCSTGCFSFGELVNSNLSVFGLDGIGAPGAPAPNIMVVTGTMRDVTITGLSPAFAGNSYYTNGLNLRGDAINSVCIACDLGGDNSTFVGLRMYGTQTNNFTVISSSGSYYNESTNPQWRDHTNFVGSQMTPTNGSGSIVLQDTTDHDATISLMADTTASAASNAGLTVRGSTGGGNVDVFMRSRRADFTIGSSFTSIPTQIYGSLNTTGSITSSATTHVFGAPGHAVTLTAGSGSFVGDWGGQLAGVNSQYGSLLFTLPTGFSSALFAGQDTSGDGRGKSCFGYSAANIGCMTEDSGHNMGFYQQQAGALVRRAYFSGVTHDFVLDNPANSNAITFSSGTGANTDAAFTVTTNTSVSPTSMASYTLAGNYSAGAPNCSPTFEFDPGLSGGVVNRVWMAPPSTSDGTHYSLSFFASGATVGGQLITVTCVSHNN